MLGLPLGRCRLEEWGTKVDSRLIRKLASYRVVRKAYSFGTGTYVEPYDVRLRKRESECFDSRSHFFHRRGFIFLLRFPIAYYSVIRLKTMTPEKVLPKRGQLQRQKGCRHLFQNEENTTDSSKSIVSPTGLNRIRYSFKIVPVSSEEFTVDSSRSFRSLENHQ